MDDLGYKDVKIVVKNDQEASIVKAQGAIRRGRDAQAVPEISPVGDSQSKGIARADQNIANRAGVTSRSQITHGPKCRRMVGGIRGDVFEQQAAA